MQGGVLMRTRLYRERDYTFGQTMTTLRTMMGLTQLALAQYLEVSRHAVQGWETGSSYPTTKHLKSFVACCVELRAFAGEREEEIRALWQAAHQKVLLDEHWLSALLRPAHPSPATATQAPTLGGLPMSRAASPLRVDWSDALDVSSFYGRELELATLQQWVLQEHCRVVSVLGMGGIGKSALVVTLMHRLAEHFEVVLFRSLLDVSSCEELVADYLKVLSPQLLIQEPTNLEHHLRLLLECLRERRVLLVLDNLETLLQDSENGGHYRPGYEGVRLLLRRAGETIHQSCLLLTSREKLTELVPLEGTYAAVRSLHLSGLEQDACEQLLVEKMVGKPEERVRLVEIYGGNPLALKIVAETIASIFAGEIGLFLAQGTTIFGGIGDLIAEQVNGLSAFEQNVLRILVIACEPLNLQELLALLIVPQPPGGVLAAIDILRRRSLIERGTRLGSVKPQSIVMEYMREQLIKEVGDELGQGRLVRLIEHGLCQATAHEDVRQAQVRVLIIPVVRQLRSLYPGRGEAETHLLTMLSKLRELDEDAQGYGPANVVALLRELRGHLRGLGLSHLVLRGAYLQGVEMQDASLVGATVRDSVFSEALDATWKITTSKNGQYWAVGNRRGEVRVWREAGQTLHLLWQAHTDTVSALAFDPDSNQLATGSWDGTITLWELEGGTPRWSVWQTNSVQSLAFTPDGRMLASSSGNATVVWLWDLSSDIPLQTLAHPAPVFSVTWSPRGRLLATGCLDGGIRLWETWAERPTVHVATFLGHSHLVRELVFAPDGSRLASGSWDRTVRLWDMESGQCLHTLSGPTERVQTVAWSPNGRTVASAGLDSTIWLWGAQRGSPRVILQGHSAPIYSIAFTPNGQMLLSGCEDGTLRVWDAEGGQCTRVMQGHAACLHDVAWSPDSKRIASAGSDRLVLLWDLSDEMPPRVLRGHHWSVDGVAWSPDGKTLASSGWDNAIRLWDPTSGICVQVLHDAEHPDTVFKGVAWSPDGRWLAGGSYLHEIQVWDMKTGRHRWVGRAHPTIIRRVAWSPDGTQLASGGDDGNLYVWDAADGALLAKLQGHRSLIACVVWSPDGTELASGGGSGGEGELFLWDAHSGQRLRAFAGAPRKILALEWSPHGELLISGGSDGMLYWWDVHSGECVGTREAHQRPIQSLKISPDGRRLASCGDDGSIQVRDLESGELQRTLRQDRPYERLNITNVKGLTQAQQSHAASIGGD